MNTIVGVAFVVGVGVVVTGYPHPSRSSTWKPRSLPTAMESSALIIGYAHDTAKVEQAIRNGVNVICWSFVDMIEEEEEKQKIVGEETMQQVQNRNVDDSQRQQQQQPSRIHNHNAYFHTNLDLRAIQSIRNAFPSVIHLAAIGGWNGPHPLGILSGKEWCHRFVQFNREHDHVFDGIDWDLEGHDDIQNSPTSRFTWDVLNVMADFSLKAKHTYGMIVSMAPAESYLDPLLSSSSSSSNTQAPTQSSSFSLALNLLPRSPWDKDILGTFQHAGRQCYAYVLHRAGIQTFDWISLQLYEAFSSFTYDTTIILQQQQQQQGANIDQRRSQADAIFQRANAFVSGFPVPIISMHQEDGTTIRIQIPLSKLVMGVANGWADGTKFCRVEPASIRDANIRLKERFGEGLRGAMFWTIDEEGTNNVYMASSLTMAFNNKQQYPEDNAVCWRRD